MSLLLHSSLQQPLEFQKLVVKDVIVEIATNILHSLDVTEPVFQDSMLKKIDTLNATTLCQYFDTNNQQHVKDLTHIIYSCMNDLVAKSIDVNAEVETVHVPIGQEVEKEIVTERAQQLDLLAVTHAVRKSSVMINNMHADLTASPVSIVPNQTATILECIFNLVVTALIPAAQGPALVLFIEDLFKLVQLQIIPVARANNCLWCKPAN